MSVLLWHAQYGLDRVEKVPPRGQKLVRNLDVHDRSLMSDGGFKRSKCSVVTELQLVL